MNIAIDIRSLISGKISGVEIYVLNLIHSLLKHDRENKYLLFYNAYKKTGAIIPKFDYPNVQIIRTYVPNKILNFCLCLLRYPKLDRYLEKRWRGGKIDVFYAPDPRPAPVRNQCLKITTFHDLSFVHLKHTFNFKTRLWHKLLNPKKEAEESDKIIAVSQSTKADLIKNYNLDENKIEVIYPGIGEGIKQITDPKIFSRIQQKYKLPPEFFLSLSTIEPRKNIEGLIEAFVQWKEGSRNSMKLVIAGKTNNKIFSRVKLQYQDNPYLIFPGFIDEQDKSALISMSKGLCFPSFFEGFGFPIIEAFACQTPVLTSNLSSMAEIASGAAILVNPYDINSIQIGFEQLITKKRRLVSQGLKKIANFDGGKSAQKILELMNNLSLKKH